MMNENISDEGFASNPDQDKSSYIQEISEQQQSE